MLSSTNRNLPSRRTTAATVTCTSLTVASRQRALAAEVVPALAVGGAESLHQCLQLIGRSGPRAQLQVELVAAVRFQHGRAADFERAGPAAEVRNDPLRIG